MSYVVLFFVFVALSYGQPSYRFDYQYSMKAGGWLKMHQVPSVWKEAMLRCHSEGAVLASPLTSQLQDALVEFVTLEAYSSYTVFTGVHSSFSKGDYTSVEGVPLSRLPLNWAPGQPDNFQNQESCLAMHTLSNGTISDVRCDDVFPYVCYRKKTGPLNITNCGTVDGEYQLDARTGSCYKFHTRGLPWSRAFMTCQGEGGHLAIINSQDEAKVLKDIYYKYSDSAIFSKDPGYAGIGFNDWGDRGTWMTIHGQTLPEAGFSRFEVGQPDNYTRTRTGDEGEFCGAIFRDANLNDIWCNVHIPFICEKDPNSLLLEVEDDY